MPWNKEEEEKRKREEEKRKKEEEEKKKRAAAAIRQAAARMRPAGFAPVGRKPGVDQVQDATRFEKVVKLQPPGNDKIFRSHRDRRRHAQLAL